jgi:hypothetical protein
MNGAISADKFDEFDEDDDEEAAAAKFVQFANEYDGQFAVLNGNGAGFVAGMKLLGVLFSGACAERFAATPTSSSIAECGCDILQSEYAHNLMTQFRFKQIFNSDSVQMQC